MAELTLKSKKDKFSKNISVMFVIISEFRKFVIITSFIFNKLRFLILKLVKFSVGYKGVVV